MVKVYSVKEGVRPCNAGCFNNNLSRIMGNRSDTSFWNDLWVGLEVLGKL